MKLGGLLQRDLSKVPSFSSFHAGHSPQEADTATDDVQKVLSALEKRIKGGPGSLSWVEVGQLKIGSNRLLLEMKKKEQAQAASEPVAPVTYTPETVQAEQKETPKAPVTPKKEITERDIIDLQVAASKCDAAAVTTLINTGVEMDKEITDAAFWPLSGPLIRPRPKTNPFPSMFPRCSITFLPPIFVTY